jgi:ankyrin repeat protein
MRLTPILQAVDSARPDVVRRILDLGAKPDIKGNANNQTALTVCLNRIGLLDQPKRWVKNQLKQPKSQVLLDVFRRVTNGQLGASLKNQEKVFEIFDPSVDFKIQTETFAKHYVENVSRKDMQEIMALLLEKGANPNALAESPLKGFTPIMMAAELDLADELDTLLQYQGNLDQEVDVFSDSGKKCSINSWDLALIYKSNKVLQLLKNKGLKPNFTLRVN